MKTVSMRAQDVERAWWVIDADGKTLGRLATEVGVVCAVSMLLSIHRTWIRVITSLL